MVFFPKISEFYGNTPRKSGKFDLFVAKSEIIGMKIGKGDPPSAPAVTACCTWRLY